MKYKKNYCDYLKNKEQIINKLLSLITKLHY